MVTRDPWIPVECAAHSYGVALLEFSFVEGLCFLALLPLLSSCQTAHSWLVFSWDHCGKCPQRRDVTCAGARLRSEPVPVSLIHRGKTELIPDADTCIPTQRCHPLAWVCWVTTFPQAAKAQESFAHMLFPSKDPWGCWLWLWDPRASLNLLVTLLRS